MGGLGSFAHGIHASKSPGDREIAELASRQHGVVAYWQLRSRGHGRGAIAHRVAAGRLHRVESGVYAVGHAVLGWHGRCMAAALTYGPGAVLSHVTAAVLHELRPSSSPVVDVTVAARGRHARDGTRLHRVRRLHSDDTTVHEGLPVTSIARTLLDFAEVRPRWELERAVEEAERRRRFDLSAIEELLDRSRGRRGVSRLRAVLADGLAPPPTRSDLERDFLDLCRAARLPSPAVNVDVAGFEVDCAWQGARLVVELDSRTHHERRSAFEADRVRDAALQLAGYRVVRVTHRRLTREPRAIAGMLSGLLAAPRG